MVKMRYNLYVRIALLLCIFVQNVVSMPHHHHAEDKTLCINVFHVLDKSNAADCNDGHKCAGHQNHQSPITTCVATHFVTLQPERDQASVSVSASSKALPKAVCDAAHLWHDRAWDQRQIVSTPYHRDWQPPRIQSWTDYAVRALPMRAPSCFA